MAQYGLTLITAPTIEPVSLAEAHLQCGVANDISYHDPKFSSLITAAREKVETDTGRAIITQTWDYTFDLLPCGLEAIYLPKNPVLSISSLKYYDTSNAQQTLSTSYYMTLLDREPGEIRLKYQQQWPSLYGERGVVTVRFVCGYGSTPASVPQSLKHAMLLLISWWFEKREAVVLGTISKNLEQSYEALITKYITGDEFHSYSRSFEYA